MKAVQIHLQYDMDTGSDISTQILENKTHNRGSLIMSFARHCSFLIIETIDNRKNSA